MIEAFYAVVALFALNDIYYIFNRKRLDLLFKNKEPENMRRLDIAHYLLKVLSVVWPIIGLFSSIWPMFVAIMLTAGLRFALYHASKEAYQIYSKAFPAISISIYVAILAIKFIR